MYVLGISAFYHDSAACIIKDGIILAAVQEERFTRKKHDPSFPFNAIKYCVSEANIQLEHIDYVVFYDKPLLKFDRLIKTYTAFAPLGIKSFLKSFPAWLSDKAFQKSNIKTSLNLLSNKRLDWENRLFFSEHHLSHAASAFFPSPFKNAAILTMDGVGEWASTSLAIGKNNNLEILKQINFPHSLGLLYSAFTYYSGFKVNSGEYKLMGLAPYGKPIYVSLIKNNLIDIKANGSFWLDISYFNYCTGLTMTNEKFHNLFGGAPREPESIITQKEMDLASSIQVVTEDILLRLAKDIRKKTAEKNLCLAGGVALNCVANGRLLKENIFNNIWIQPASGDAGGAVGAALAFYYLALNSPRNIVKTDSMNGSYLGPRIKKDEIKKTLIKLEANFKEKTQTLVIKEVAKKIAGGCAVGWVNGRMEFGPRSLGSRSILADPRSHNMQKILNLKVKFRESFRPFAPAVLKNKVSKWFNLSCESPYMLFVVDIKKSKQIQMTEKENKLFGIDKLNIIRSKIPAVTHVDYSARVQTVSKKTNSNFYKLLCEFDKITGCPILINTSFNIRGEPIVNNIEDAYRCFMGSELDILVIENFILYKKNQNKKLLVKYKDNYDLD